jgi:hypothetical protein
MRKSTKTTQDNKNYIFYDHIPGGLLVFGNASKLVFTTPDVNKYLFYNHIPGGLAVCAYAMQLIFTNSRRQKLC